MFRRTPFQGSMEAREDIIHDLQSESGNKMLILDYMLMSHHFKTVINAINIHEADKFGTIEIVQSHADDFIGGPQAAQLIEKSSTLRCVQLFYNHFTEKTLFAVARALFTNTSVQILHLTKDNCRSMEPILDALVFALRINPSRPALSSWSIDENSNAYAELKARAEALGHPTMLDLLVYKYEPSKPLIAHRH